MVDRDRALHLLLGRYRYEEAMRLFGEYCLLLEEDWNDFIARHSPPRLRTLHRQLHAVGLWPPELVPPVRGTGLLAQASAAMTGLLGGLKGSGTVVGVTEPVHEPSPAMAAETAMGRDPDVVLQSLVAPGISVELSPDLNQHPVVGATDSPLLDAIALTRYRMAHDLGFVFPLVHLRENTEVAAGHYAIRLNGETVAEGRLAADSVAAIGAGLLPVWPIEPHPSRHVPMSWITPELAKTWEGEIQAPHLVLAEHLEDVIRRNAHRLFNNQALDMLLRTYEPEVGKDTLSELFGRFLSLSELRLVMQAMLEAGYSVRNLPKIVDILMSHFINYLAEKPLSMDETWKISSHIPFFSTEELTRVVCTGLGLPVIGDRKRGLTAALERAVKQAHLPPNRGRGGRLPERDTANPGISGNGPKGETSVGDWDGLETRDRHALDSEEGVL